MADPRFPDAIDDITDAILAIRNNQLKINQEEKLKELKPKDYPKTHDMIARTLDHICHYYIEKRNIFLMPTHYHRANYIIHFIESINQNNMNDFVRNKNERIILSLCALFSLNNLLTECKSTEFTSLLNNNILNAFFYSQPIKDEEGNTHHEILFSDTLKNFFNQIFKESMRHIKHLMIDYEIQMNHRAPTTPPQRYPGTSLFTVLASIQKEGKLILAKLKEQDKANKVNVNDEPCKRNNDSEISMVSFYKKNSDTDEKEYSSSEEDDAIEKLPRKKF